MASAVGGPGSGFTGLDAGLSGVAATSDFGLTGNSGPGTGIGGSASELGLTGSIGGGLNGDLSGGFHRPNSVDIGAGIHDIGMSAGSTGGLDAGIHSGMSHMGAGMGMDHMGASGS